MTSWPPDYGSGSGDAGQQAGQQGAWNSASGAGGAGGAQDQVRSQPQPTWPQDPASQPQQGWGQEQPQAYPSPQSYPQPYPQAPQAYPQAGYPQAGYQQAGYQQAGYAQSGYPQAGFGTGYGAGYGQPQNQVTSAAGQWLSICSLIAGILSVLLCFLGLITLFEVVLSMVLGGIALSTGSSIRGVAIAGMVCGGVGFIFYLFVGLFSFGVGWII